jgi:OB-fold nucleic acid binding domain
MDACKLSLLFVASVVFVWSAFASPAEALTRAAGATPPTPVWLAQLSAADAGRRVTVRGTVVSTANFSKGFRFGLNDATGQVTLVIWGDDWDHVRDNYRLNTGAVVSVTGAVDVYNGEIEIMPDWGSDVHVIKPAVPTVPPMRKYDLGSLNGNDHNAVVQVEGVIKDIQPFALGTSLLVYDASGAQKVTLYDVVASRIPKQEKTWVGRQVSIVGRVRARRYYGIDIVVALPQDVTIK